MKKLLRIFGIFILLLVFAHVALNLIWGMQLRNTVRDLKAQGKLKSWDEIKPPPVPDDENAAIIYKEILTLMTKGKGGKPFLPARKGWSVNDTIESIESMLEIEPSKWTQKQILRISQFIRSAEMQEIYEKIHEASKKPKCNFNFDYENWDDVFTIRTGALVHIGKLLAVKALIEAHTGKVNEALDTILTGFKVSNHLKNETTTIGQHARIAVNTLMIFCIKTIPYRNHPKKEKINLAIKELSSLEHSKSMSRNKIIDGLTSSVITTTEKTLQGKLRWKDYFGSDMPFEYKLYTSYIGRPFLKKDILTFLTVMPEIKRKYDGHYYKFASELEKNPISKRLPDYFLISKPNVISLEEGIKWEAQYQANIEIAKVGLALKMYKIRYGYYPFVLNNISPEILSKIPLDPHTGKNLMYKKLENGFVLYSLGSDTKDDNGTPAYISPFTQLGSGDIVWKSEK